MKNTGLILTTLTLLFSVVFSCNAQSPEAIDAAEEIKTEQVGIYYFHYERRCATCLSVENESEKILGELYPEKLQSGEMFFLSVNLEDKTNDALAEKLNVDGQTLLVVKGDKQENLTNTAFMHARTNPDKLKKAIRESIEKL